MPLIPCRLIVDAPAGGAWNMAVDDALLDATARDGVATLRFYQWSEPTLSLGYFQPYADRERHVASLACACVRRHSGGGAILHDRELTYSLTVPATRAHARDPHALYLAAHESLAAVLRGLAGPEEAARVALRREGASAAPSEPFLCFRRQSLGDVVVSREATGLARDSHLFDKVAGSSQRKRRGAILQHGSLLVARSRYAPELPGIAEALGVSTGVEELRAAWAPRLAAAAGLSLDTEGAADLVAQEARRVANEKFAQPAWLKRR